MTQAQTLYATASISRPLRRPPPPCVSMMVERGRHMPRRMIVGSRYTPKPALLVAVEYAISTAAAAAIVWLSVS